MLYLHIRIIRQTSQQTFQSFVKNLISRIKSFVAPLFQIGMWRPDSKEEKEEEGVDNHHSFIPLDLTLLLSKNKSIYFHLTEDRHSLTVP